MTPSMKQGILNDALQVSSGLRDRMIETYGIENFNDLPQINLDIYFNQAVLFVESELNQMGVRFVQGDLMNDAVMLETLIRLRAAFDGPSLHKTISESDTLREMLQAILDNNMYEPTLLVTQVLTGFHNAIPISTTWHKAYNQRYLVENTSLFISHIQAILNKPALLTDGSISKQLRYARVIYLHSNVVKENIVKLVGILPEVGNFTDFNFTNYDRDLVRMPNDAILMYLDSGNPHPLLRREVGDVPFIARHKGDSEHHFEYYINKQINPTPKQQALLVAELCIPEWSRETRIDVISGFLKIAQFTNETNESILKMVNLL